MSEPRALVEHFFRHEFGRLVALLTRSLGGRRLGPFYTLGELSLKNRAARIRYEIDKLHDRVIKARDVIPTEPAGSRPRGVSD